MSSLGRGIRRSGILHALQPPKVIQQQQAVARVIDPTGQFDPRALTPYLPLVGDDWGPGETGRKRVRQPGVVVLLAARLTTAPSSGDAVVILTQETEVGGIETLVTLHIPQGQRFAQVAPMVAVPAGAWLDRAITTAAGASGVTVSYSMRVG